MSGSKPNLKSISLMLLLVAALAAVLASAGCSGATAVSDTPPAFPDPATVPNQTYTVGEAITRLTLPEASGGNGPLSYTLQPAVPGADVRRGRPYPERHADRRRHLRDAVPGAGWRRQY